MCSNQQFSKRTPSKIRLLQLNTRLKSSLCKADMIWLMPSQQGPSSSSLWWATLKQTHSTRWTPRSNSSCHQSKPPWPPETLLELLVIRSSAKGSSPRPSTQESPTEWSVMLRTWSGSRTRWRLGGTPTTLGRPLRWDWKKPWLCRSWRSLWTRTA